MTSLIERERCYYWRFSRELADARSARDRERVEDARAELEGIALHSEDPQLRRLAREAVDAARSDLLALTA